MPYFLSAVLIACFLPLNSAFKLSNSSNFRATFGDSPSPFTIDVEPAFVARTKEKASLTRYAVDLDQLDFVDGPPRENVSAVRDYWTNHYKWSDVQELLNAEYVRFYGLFLLRFCYFLLMFRLLLRQASWLYETSV